MKAIINKKEVQQSQSNCESFSIGELKQPDITFSLKKESQHIKDLKIGEIVKANDIDFRIYKIEELNDSIFVCSEKV